MVNPSSETLDYLTNPHLLDVDQDIMIAPATVASRGSVWDVLTKTLHNGDRLFTLFNRGNTTASVNSSWSRLGLTLPNVLNGSHFEVTD
jgi:alpha-galactosidase